MIPRIPIHAGSRYRHSHSGLYRSSARGYEGAGEHPSGDLLELVLSLADQSGMKVYLGSLQTATDCTDGTEFAALRAYNQRVATEVIQRYGRHSSLRGWYFAQEIWMNWVKEYGDCYDGTELLANWAADMKKSIRAGRLWQPL